MTEQHWSQRPPTKETARLRRTLFVQLILPAFGRALVICECGARVELQPEATVNSVGRPRKPRTAQQAAEEWAANHVAQNHASLDEWELRTKHLLRPPREGELP